MTGIARLGLVSAFRQTSADGHARTGADLSGVSPPPFLLTHRLFVFVDSLAPGLLARDMASPAATLGNLIGGSDTSDRRSKLIPLLKKLSMALNEAKRKVHVETLAHGSGADGRSLVTGLRALMASGIRRR